MKKFIVSVVVLAIAFAFCLQTSATSSVTIDSAPVVTAVKAGDGTNLNPMIIIVTPYSQIDTLPEDSQKAMREVYAEITETENLYDFVEKIGLKDELNEAFPEENATGNSLFDLYMNDVADEWLEQTGKLTVVFDIPTIKVGDKAVVFHRIKETGEWENVPSTIENGKIISTFTSHSPILIITEGNDPSVEAVQFVFSPDTSDPSVNSDILTYVVLLVAAIALSVLAVSRKRV